MYVRLSGESFGVLSSRDSDLTFWQMRLSLAHGDFVNITQRSDAGELPVLVGPFVEVLRRTIPEKLEQLRKQMPARETALQTTRYEATRQMPVSSLH
jgi:hypothetical protein